MLSGVTASLMTHAVPAKAGGERMPRYVAGFAETRQEMRAAQRLRAEVFSAEYGVRFSHPLGLDADGYDEHCLHLNVYDTRQSRLIATTRLLTGERARQAGGFYSAGEFDLTALLPNLDGRVLEIGRTCVHPDYRSGAAITVMWSALADYLLEQDFAYLIGCASIHLAGDGGRCRAILDSLEKERFLPEAWQVHPRQRLPSSPSLYGDADAVLPPLLKAYLRMNARIGGEACWDPEFNCADLFVLLDVSALSGRYAQRFLRAA